MIIDIKDNLGYSEKEKGENTRNPMQPLCVHTQNVQVS